MDQIDDPMDHGDLEDGEVLDSDEDVTIVNIIPPDKATIICRKTHIKDFEFERDCRKYRKRHKRSRSSSSSSSSSDSSTTSRLVIDENEPLKSNSEEARINVCAVESSSDIDLTKRQLTDLESKSPTPAVASTSKASLVPKKVVKPTNGPDLVSKNVSEPEPPR